MSLSLVKTALSANRTLSQQSIDAWIRDQELRAEKVALFRDYAEGNHRANLTPEMRRLLRISANGSLNEFSNNYMDIVIQTMVDRLRVKAIEADTDAGSKWVTDLLKRERFDGMQHDVHEATVRDGDGFVMAYYDNEEKQTCFKRQKAYDGVEGVIVLYDSTDSKTPSVALKIWHITMSEGNIADTMRVNVYYPDRIERYISQSGAGMNASALVPYETETEPAVSEWMLGGEPLGVPIVHFRNRTAMHSNYGMSEIENAIPLQDALNRTLYSMVMAAELTAFQIRYAVGWNPPAALTPGMWLKISPEVPLTADEKIDVGTMDQGEVTPFLDMARYLAGEIGNVTNTPRLTPQGMGSDTASGEALKQREIGLIGKTKRFQTKAGNAWEDVITLAHRIESAYGEPPPAIDSINTLWEDAEIRNDEQLIKNADLVKDRVDERTYLEMIAPVFGWDAAKIDQIIEAKQAERTKQLEELGGNLPGFGAFNVDDGGAGQQPPALQIKPPAQNGALALTA